MYQFATAFDVFVAHKTRLSKRAKTTSMLSGGGCVCNASKQVPAWSKRLSSGGKRQRDVRGGCGQIGDTGREARVLCENMLIMALQGGCVLKTSAITHLRHEMAALSSCTHTYHLLLLLQSQRRVKTAMKVFEKRCNPIVRLSFVHKQNFLSFVS